MKTIYKSFVFLIIAIGFSRLQAQTINTIDFTITSKTLSVMGKTLPASSTITKSGDTLTWAQSTEENVSSSNTTVFKILDTLGNWDTAAGLGEVTYNMSLGGHQCLLKLTGNSQGISAKLSFLKSNNGQGDYTFNISNITYQ